MGKQGKSNNDVCEKRMYSCKNLLYQQMFDHRMKGQRHYKKCEKNKPCVKYELKDSRYLCSKCGRSFTKQSNASCHVREPCRLKEAPAKTYSFYCRVCEKFPFPYKFRLTKHVWNLQVTVPSIGNKQFTVTQMRLFFTYPLVGFIIQTNLQLEFLPFCQYCIFLETRFREICHF